MERYLTNGNEPLGPAGLVAFMECGHWWVYPFRMSSERMHDLARFNAGILCSFCLAELQAMTRPQARGTTLRVN